MLQCVFWILIMIAKNTAEVGGKLHSPPAPALRLRVSEAQARRRLTVWEQLSSYCGGPGVQVPWSYSMAKHATSTLTLPRGFKCAGNGTASRGHHRPSRSLGPRQATPSRCRCRVRTTASLSRQWHSRKTQFRVSRSAGVPEPGPGPASRSPCLAVIVTPPRPQASSSPSSESYESCRV